MYGTYVCTVESVVAMKSESGECALIIRRYSYNTPRPKMKGQMKSLLALFFLLAASSTTAFRPSATKKWVCNVGINSRSITRLSQSESEKPEYTREIYLREEIESPFRKIRFFFYFSLGGGALTSLAISLARVAAGLAGVNEDLLEQSAINVGVDVLGIIVIGLLWRNDLTAQESRLKRASKGAELAKLMVRGSKAMIQNMDVTPTGPDSFTTSLASLRRGRGIEKRVVIAAAGKDKIQEVLKEASSLEDSLVMNDLLIVPVVLPQALAPEVENRDDLPECIALPVGSNWRFVMEDEGEEAISQGVSIEEEGFCVILKKNGRVGQRTRGIFLGRMVGEVTDRRELGLDVKNI